MSDKKNVFISHIHEDDERLAKLKDAVSSQGLDIRDASINSEKPNKAKAPDYIKQDILAPQITWAGSLIVLISKDTHKSEWVNWEIEYASKQEMPIIGVWDLGETDAEIPKAFKEFGGPLVPWNPEKICKALNGEIVDWENPDGEKCPPTNIVRISCQ